MAIKKTKWYTNKWTYIIGIILVVGSYFAYTEGPQYFNVNSYLKQLNKEKDEVIKEKELIISEQAKQIKKLKEINIKITTTEEKQRTKRLEEELKLLQEKEKVGVEYKQLTPVELKNYFNKIINKQNDNN